jgi:hypothetical protein
MGATSLANIGTLLPSCAHPEDGHADSAANTTPKPILRSNTGNLLSNVAVYREIHRWISLDMNTITMAIDERMQAEP